MTKDSPPANVSSLTRLVQTLRLSNAARCKKTVGEIINLMAIDADIYMVCASCCCLRSQLSSFQQFTPQVQQFWSCPYQLR